MGYDILSFHLLNGRDSCRNRESLSEHGSGIEDVIGRFHLPHDLSLANQGRQWHPISHRLAEGSQIGSDTVILLCTAHRPAEAGNDFIEDQNDTMEVASFSEPLQELWTNVWFYDDSRDMIAQPFPHNIIVTIGYLMGGHL